MKITKTQLKKIIKEEMDSQNLDEIFGFGKRDTSNDRVRGTDFAVDGVKARISADVTDGEFEIRFALKGKEIALTGTLDKDSLEFLVDKMGFKRS